MTSEINLIKPITTLKSLEECGVLTYGKNQEGAVQAYALTTRPLRERVADALNKAKTVLTYKQAQDKFATLRGAVITSQSEIAVAMETLRKNLPADVCEAAESQRFFKNLQALCDELTQFVAILDKDDPALKLAIEKYEGRILTKMFSCLAGGPLFPTLATLATGVVLYKLGCCFGVCTAAFFPLGIALIGLAALVFFKCIYDRCCLQYAEIIAVRDLNAFDQKLIDLKPFRLSIQNAS